MIRVFFLLLAAALAACASVAKLQSGEQTIGDRLVLTFDGAWNEVGEQTWTREGLPIDELRLFPGIRDGEPLGAGGPLFRSAVPQAEIPALFGTLLSSDGSTFTLRKVEPCDFAGGGYRFEYSLRRKLDNVELAGLGYASVRQGVLFAMLYSAPKLAFFDRYKRAVEHMARSVRIKA